jgi:predicted DCC family thiol-disulfide oxidoreductase YuxK
MDPEFSEQVVFYDQDCALCNYWVRFLFRRDRRHHLRFAPLAGRTAVLLGISSKLNARDTLFFYQKGSLYSESGGAIRALAATGFPGRLSYLFLIVPGHLRNSIYRWVSRNRYKWFGETTACRILTETERVYFYD